MLSEVACYNFGMKGKHPGFFQKVYQFLEKVPAGQVVTYGQIAKALGTADARKVGWALHANKNPQIPCHRVVSKDGLVSDAYAFEGWQEQKRKLQSEGVEFVSQKQVNLIKHNKL